LREKMAEKWIITYLFKPTNTPYSEVVVPNGPLHKKLLEMQKKGLIEIRGMELLNRHRCPNCGSGYIFLSIVKRTWPFPSRGYAKCMFCGWETRDYKIVKQILKGK